MNFLWVDCEMTGLDSQKDFLLELAVVLTDKNLNILYKNEWIFKTEKNKLDLMNDFCFNLHKNSGLYGLCLNSEVIYSDAENELIDILKKNTKEKEVFLAGNSVFYDFFFYKKISSKN